ncbi:MULTISPECIES: beta-class carbonic anhydrase [Bacillus]|jgi:carbonic anhydrase|uniref:beta-class carbonic anhydrase n=1 Tax=Bacillus TaxID=1386 RepID=UPI00065E6BB3|nr:carbonic anhydrase [Bacillus smithii]AKP46084.1 Carbonic anhydrase [Bacillus smithii]MED0659522.1 carbonic anhydrase [Bacillus smithii]MED4883672.1 carbonic anhydrase [Bacillus smithii]MED4927976.1 carbonic anhydrase [Bacillus smithii]
MSLLDDILSFNEKFVENKEYKKYETSKFPNKRCVILTCMDTRLVELLPKALNIKNGDVKMVRSAGALVDEPFGMVMKSLLVAVYELQADEVFVIGHYDCGMGALKSKTILADMKERGIKEETFSTLKHAGIDLDHWLNGFESVEKSVSESVHMIKRHPLFANDIPVHGLAIDPSTGKLDLIINGYENV